MQEMICVMLPGMSRSASRRAPQEPAAREAPRVRVGRARSLTLSVALACFGTPVLVTLWNAGNRFGPIKMTALCAAAALCAGALAVNTDLLDESAALLRRSRIAQAVACLVGVAALGALAGGGQPHHFLGFYPSFRGLLLLLACATTMLAAGVAARRVDLLERMWWPLAACSFVVLGGAVLQRLGVVAGAFARNEPIPRVFATLGNSSNLGVFLVGLLPLTAGSALLQRTAWRRHIALALALVWMPALLWTSSRGALVGAAGAVVSFMILRYRGRRRSLTENRRGLLTAAAVALGIAVAATVTTPGLSSRLASLVSLQGRSVGIRVGIWRSTLEAVAARPLLGWGPGSFQTTFPRYMRPGTIDGLDGPTVVEAAHNFLLDGAVSWGLLGLALAVVALVASVRTVMRHDSSDREGITIAAAVVALAGMLVALMFHYVTPDTGPLMAFCLGLIAAAESRADAEKNPTPGHRTAVRAAFALVTAGLAVAAFLYALTTAADTYYARGLTLARSGAPWAVARQPLARAVSIAPWEPHFAEGIGGAAALVISRDYDADAYFEGRAAYARALTLKPRDAFTLAADGALTLVAATRTRSPELYAEALRLYEQAVAADPANGVTWTGYGSCLAGLGRWTEAVSAYERAVDCSPRYLLALENLALAYRTLGRTDEAAAVQAGADSLKASIERATLTYAR